MAGVDNFAKLGTGARNLAISVGVLLAVGAVVYVVWKGKKAVAAVGRAVNPASPDNLAHQGITKIVQGATGDEGATLGNVIYDFFHRAEIAKQLAPTPYRTDGKAPQVR